ncbi:MAG: hypothetical protein AAF915_12155 [Cyanobacteria bacterium P01_D01_bin.50]
MGYRTTVGWSLLSSGFTTLLLKGLSGDSLWWGVAFLVGGIVTLFIRKGIAE